MSRTITLCLPMPENLGNSRMHWRVKHNAKVAYFDTLDTMQAAKLLPAPPATPMASARIASVMYLGAKMDADNAMARHKWTLDWLQGAGYIRNDRELVWSGVPEQVVKRDGNYRIELTLTELP